MGIRAESMGIAEIGVGGRVSVRNQAGPQQRAGFVFRSGRVAVARRQASERGSRPCTQYAAERERFQTVVNEANRWWVSGSPGPIDSNQVISRQRDRGSASRRQGEDEDAIESGLVVSCRGDVEPHGGPGRVESRLLGR